MQGDPRHTASNVGEITVDLKHPVASAQAADTALHTVDSTQESAMLYRELCAAAKRAGGRFDFGHGLTLERVGWRREVFSPKM